MPDTAGRCCGSLGAFTPGRLGSLERLWEGAEHPDDQTLGWRAMSRRKRLGKLEQAAAKQARARDFAAVSIRWVTPDGVPEIPPSSGKSPAMTISLTRRADSPGSAPEWLDAAAPEASQRSEQPAPRGQRPRLPTEAERAAAIEVLRERARLGQYAGELPPSEAEIAAEWRRREVDREAEHRQRERSGRA
jgi:hypothetical protein